MRIATAGVRTGFAMTPLTRSGGRADVGIGPYGELQGMQQNGPSGTPAPTKAYLAVRKGGVESRPYGGVTRSAVG